MDARSVVKCVALVTLGALGATATAIISSGEPACPDVITVAFLVDGCMEGDKVKCRTLDVVVPSSCLTERAMEVTDLKRQMLQRPREAEEFVL